MKHKRPKSLYFLGFLAISLSLVFAFILSSSDTKFSLSSLANNKINITVPNGTTIKTFNSITWGPCNSNIKYKLLIGSFPRKGDVYTSGTLQYCTNVYNFKDPSVMNVTKIPQDRKIYITVQNANRAEILTEKQVLISDFNEPLKVLLDSPNQNKDNAMMTSNKILRFIPLHGDAVEPFLLLNIGSKPGLSDIYTATVPYEKSYIGPEGTRVYKTYVEFPVNITKIPSSNEIFVRVVTTEKVSKNTGTVDYKFKVIPKQNVIAGSISNTDLDQTLSINDLKKRLLSFTPGVNIYKYEVEIIANINNNARLVLARRQSTSPVLLGTLFNTQINPIPESGEYNADLNVYYYPPNGIPSEAIKITKKIKLKR